MLQNYVFATSLQNNFIKILGNLFNQPI